MKEGMKDLLRLLGLFRPYMGWMLLGIFLSLLTLMANIVLLALSGWFLAAMALAGVAGVPMNYFTPAAIIRAMAMIRTAGRYGERLVTHEATFRLLSQLRRWFYERLEPLAPAGLEGYRAGDLLSRIRADIDTLENFYLRFLVPVSVAAISSIGFVVFLSFYSLPLATAELSLLVFAGVALPLLIGYLARDASRRQTLLTAEMRGRIVENTQGLGELIAFGAIERHEQRVEVLSDYLIEDQKRLSALQGLSQGGVGLAANFAMWSALIFAIPLVAPNDGGTAVLGGAMLPMLALFALASFEAILALPPAFQSLPMVLAASRRLFELADKQPAIAEPATASPKPETMDIELRGVHFRYAPGEREVLKGVDLALAEGQKLAIVGPTGSGKSSIINLLMKFYAPQEGVITFGGYDLLAYKGEDLRRLFAVVPQSVHLFNTTIRHNLLLGDLNANSDALERACRTAQIHDFIAGLPDGYDTFVGEAGLKLSGGQKRRIAIARALLKDAPIVILDEPGEGLDPVLEEKVLTGVLSSLKGKSVLLITHSRTALDQMDEIVLLDDGRMRRST